MNATFDTAVPAPGHGFARVAATVEQWIGAATAIVAAGLLLVAFVFLTVSVSARYFLDSPIYWADEFSTFLLTWIGMLGVVVAAIRGDHMKMTFATAKLSPARAARLQRVVDAASLALYAGLTAASFAYAWHEIDIPSPGLEVSMLWKLAALPIGFGLLTLLQALASLREHGARFGLASIVLAGAVVVAAAHVRGSIDPLPAGTLALVFLAATILLVSLGAHIAVVFAGVGMVYLTFATTYPLTIAGSRIEEGISNYQLLAIPLFIFLGVVIDKSGVAKALVDFLALLLYRVRGGLSYVLLGSTYVVSGISGSQAADMAAVAPALFPEMKRRGMDDGELVSLLSAAGAMSLPVPPSLVMIAIGSVCGVSIAAMFSAGFAPAAVSLLALCAVVWWRERRRSGSAATPKRIRPMEVVAAAAKAAPVVALVLMIRAAVVSGVATATEVSTIAVAASVILGLFVYRTFDWKSIYPGLVATVSLTGALLFIIGAATVMSWILTQSGLSNIIVSTMRGMPGGTFSFIALSIVIFILLGSALEGIPAIVLLGPLLFPVARSLGLNDVHYAMIMMLAMGIGLFLPPIGVGFYAACAIGQVDPSRALAKTWVPLAALLVALIVVAAVPEITTFLID